MKAACQICADPCDARYHETCLVKLFKTTKLPSLDIDLARLHTFALAMAGKTTLSGAQRKLSLNLDAKRETLQVSTAAGRFILKPQAHSFPHLPEIEWTSQRLASVSGLLIPLGALVPLADGTPAYIVERFDRTPTGKLQMEDFCQLAQKPPRHKYEGTAELCTKIIKRYSSAPGVDLLALFRVLVFSWWNGNGDLHLKNLALLEDAQGSFRLSPIYDQVNTKLLIPNDPLALSIQGKLKGIKRKTLLDLASNTGLGIKAAKRVLDEQASRTSDSIDLIMAGSLPKAMKDDWVHLIKKRSQTLSS